MWLRNSPRSFPPFLLFNLYNRRGSYYLFISWYCYHFIKSKPKFSNINLSAVFLIFLEKHNVMYKVSWSPSHDHGSVTAGGTAGCCQPQACLCPGPVAIRGPAGPSTPGAPCTRARHRATWQPMSTEPSCHTRSAL